MNRFSRRNFLKGAGAAGIGALAAPMFVPSHVLGADATQPAPSNRIAVGCIGVANQGGVLMNNMLGKKEGTIVAVCDVDEPTRKKRKGEVEAKYADAVRAGTYKGCEAYEDFRDLVARKDIDAVMIAVPDHWHALISIAAMKAGKDVYCEKPLALTIKEGRAMVEAARRFNRIFQTGSMQRSDAGFRQVCEAVRNGRIGKVQTVHVNVGGPSGPCNLPVEPTPAGMNWELWIGPAPYRGFNRQIHPYNWRNYKDYSGGGMTDWGAHHFDIAQWALGMDESGPVEVTPPDKKDVKNLTYKYANGVVMYHARVAENHPQGRVLKQTDAPKDPNEVYGVLFTGEKGQIEVNRGYKKSWPDEILAAPTRADEEHLYVSREHVADWISCVKSRKKPICDVEIGHRSATVCHLGNIAYWSRKKLAWDPVKEEIADADLNKMLSRPYRGEWTL